MATSVTFNNTTYSIPANREPRGWGTSLSSFLVDVANSSLSKAGGSFTLTADANFGSNYGLVVKYIKSVSSNIAASGVVRLANTDKIAFRNNANGADLSLGVSTGDRLQFESVNIPTISSTDTLTNKTIVAANNTVTTAASGNLEATELNAALAELQTDIDTRATSEAPVITGGATVRGTLLLQNTSGAQPELQLSEDPDNGTSKVAIKAPASLSGDYTLTLPSDDGDANQVLQTDGSGGLSWVSPLTNPMSAVGDVIVGGTSGATTRLPTSLLGDVAAEAANSTVTMTIASPCVVTLSSHGLVTGDKVYLTTTGALPTGLSTNTTYFVTRADANTFSLSTSLANVLAGTKINTTGSQSGTHTLWYKGLIINPETRRGVYSGATIASGYIGEIAVPGTTLRSATGGYTYSVRTTTAATNSLASTCSLTLKKGVYLVSAQARAYSTAATTYLGGELRIGSTVITTAALSQNYVTSSSSGAVSLVLPVVIDVDDTVVNLYTILGTGVVAGQANEMWAVRIA